MNFRGFSRHAIPALAWLIMEIGAASAQQPQDQAKHLQVNSARLESGLLALSEIGKTPQGGVSRPAFSEADLKARRLVIGRMEEAGLTVRLDEAGNIIGTGLYGCPTQDPKNGSARSSGLTQLRNDCIYTHAG